MSLSQPYSSTSFSTPNSPSFIYHFFFFWFTTLLMHKSLTLLLPAYRLPVSLILPPVVTIPPQTAFTDYHPAYFFWANRFFIYFSLFPIFGAERLINLAFRQRLSARKYTISYRIISYRIDLLYVWHTTTHLCIALAIQFSCCNSRKYTVG